MKIPRRTATIVASLTLVVGMLALAGPLPQDRAKVADVEPGSKGHAQMPVGVKSPIQEILHCPLAFAGVHLLKDLPEHPQVAYHYCKPVNDDVSQCVLYDGTGPDAKLIGIEYLVSDAIYRTMPPEEKVYWHDHKYEVDSGLLKSLTQTGAEEEKAMKAVRPLWGKVFHTWATGKTYPSGPPRLFWAVTGEEPYVLSPDAKLPIELEERRAKSGKSPVKR